jgi:hypothetical protein
MAMTLALIRSFSSTGGSERADQAFARAGLLLLSVLLLAFPIRAGAADENASLNELVFKGTHNSYHRRPLLAIHPRHRYEHDSLGVQLEHLGVRAMELDLHRHRSGRFEVYHIAVLDERSHCKIFADCLRQIRAWSDLDRSHEPLMIWLEVKDFAGGEEIESLRPVDALIRGVLGDRLITPDDVRGSHGNLRLAIERDGWPDLASSRGKVLFMLTASATDVARYTSGLLHLRGRVMFPEAKSDQFHMPWAAVAKLGVMEMPSIDLAREGRLLLTTTVCVAEMDDWECLRDRILALSQGINVLLDDYVRPTRGRDYFLDVRFHQIADADDRKSSAPDEAPPTM